MYARSRAVISSPVRSIDVRHDRSSGHDITRLDFKTARLTARNATQDHDGCIRSCIHSPSDCDVLSTDQSLVCCLL